MQDEFLRLQGLLQKTILFVTHDFDEALRLADRIAIMKDGVIEQLDTPANIVLRPATDYVAKFTRDVPREKVLSCANLMEPLGSGPLSALTVPKDALIATVAEAILGETHPVQVVDAAGTPCGQLNRKTVLHILFGARSPHGLAG
jgi:glycine betaine/proline transport system ATP-binding protein